MSDINIALLGNYSGTIDFTQFDISNNYIDTNLLNLITTDNSINLGILIEPDKKLKSLPKTSRGIGGKKPGDARFNIKSHLSYIENLKNSKVPGSDISNYLFKLNTHNSINTTKYVNDLRNIYEYDIYSDNNDINYILNKYYY
jgi:hypothetical protein|tara:strand:+ start:313 stop:741 length:429 start_codon:yes stop_codon:yes gene_type:complete